MGIWKELFGESQRDAWARLAEEIGGTFEAASWGPHKVRAQLGGSEIVLDTYTVSSGNSQQTYTRLQAPFVNPRGLRFGIHRTSIFSGLGKLLGGQDLEIGVPDFDHDFVIQGNDPARIRQFLQDPTLRGLIAAQPRVRIEIADNEGRIFGEKYGAGVDVLRFTEGGVIKNVARLTGLFSLLAGLLHAFRDGARHFLEVPRAELPAAFHHALDGVVESLGGDAERVGETVEARIPDPLGLSPETARVVVDIPTLPSLSSSLRFTGPLPPGATFTAEKRPVLALGALETDARVDKLLAVRGAPAAVPAVRAAARPLAELAPLAPRVEAGDEALSVVVERMDAQVAPTALGLTLDLWQELSRTRAGLS